jgi:Zn-dependent protease with chaperone function
MLSEADAPTLWQRVREMAEKLATAAPDRIVVGVEPNFFVTEHPVALTAGTQEGRTLYLSLPMLKILRVDEADAILGHELAHFSGEDTLWSRKIAPLRAKFALYLQALGHGLSLVIAHFMHAFWKLYGLSMNRLSRQREFRADQIGAELTSKDAAKRALIKVTSYCDFRSATERAILEQEKVDQGLDLALKLEQGYPAFLASFSTNTKAVEERVPHPFDSHPTLSNRLEHLGFDPREALLDRDVQQPVGDSWYRAIIAAETLEKQLWAEQQKALLAYHMQDLLWRLLPTSEENIALLREHFPRVVFVRKSGNGEATVEFDRLHLS